MNFIKKIKYIGIFCITVLFSFCCVRWAVAQEFIEGFDDIPVMSGLYQLQNDNISFGNEETRLVEAYLTGKKVSFTDIAAFYTETLPQLGWNLVAKQNNKLLFEREDERLDIVCEQKSPLLIRITLKSKN